MISFIIPAHNEQAVIGRTLEAIHDAGRAVGQPYEAIVADDASTDATAEIARQHQAIVVPVNHRQIAATRNAGGRKARGDRLFFVDADTTVNPRAVAAALRHMEKGAAGGGGPVWFDGEVPLYGRLVAVFLGIVSKLVGFTGGAFMFCTRKAFLATGGFDERLYWAEEGVFAMALKREGRFVVLWERVVTSGRRFRTMSVGAQMLGFLGRLVLSPAKTFTQRSSVEKIWYDSDRQNDHVMPDTLAAKFTNAIVLLIVIVLLTGPLWNFVPRSLTPWSSPLGKFRFGVGIMLCHAGLIFWPAGVALFGSLIRRKYWIEWIKLALLFAFCVWQAWGSTNCVVRIWAHLYQWLAGTHVG